MRRASIGAEVLIPDSSSLQNVAKLAQGLLLRRPSLQGNEVPLIERLSLANIDSLTRLDDLLLASRERVKRELKLRTLGETDRIIYALRRARMEAQQADPIRQAR